MCDVLRRYVTQFEGDNNMERNYKKLQKYLAGFVLMMTIALIGSCQKAAVDDESSGRYLYVASGLCYSGTGITTYTGSTSSRMVSKVNLSTQEATTFIDLASPYQGGDFAPQTSPQSIIEDGNNILMLTENATATGDRKIFTVPKSSSYNASTYASDTTAFTNTAGHILRSLIKDNDGTLLFSKSIAIEKVGTNTLRVPMGANPWINAPAGNCATSVTQIQSHVVLPPYTGKTTGKVIFAHVGNTLALNRLGVISSDGYNVAGDCYNGYQLSSQTHNYGTGVSGPVISFSATGPNVTAMVYISTGSGTGKLITGYSASAAADLNNNSTLNYALVMWDVTESSATVATITNPIVIYNNFADIFGISAMTYDSSTNSLYVATASQAGVANQTTASYGYKVEKFTIDVTNATATLVRPNNKPFLDRSSRTKCISSMFIGS